MRINPQFNQIPQDSYASIQTQGLLGGKYIGISPGGSDSYLKEGGRIDQTQSAIVLESLINKLFANFADKAGSVVGTSCPGAATPTTGTSRSPACTIR